MIETYTWLLNVIKKLCLSLTVLVVVPVLLSSFSSTASIIWLLACMVAILIHARLIYLSHEEYKAKSFYAKIGAYLSHIPYACYAFVYLSLHLEVYKKQEEPIKKDKPCYETPHMRDMQQAISEYIRKKGES